MNDRSIWITFAIWIIIKIGLETKNETTFIKSIINRPELVTPLTGWKELQEGLYLYKEGIDPYDGDIFNQSPLLLYLFSILNSPILISLVYSSIECWISFMLLKLFKSKLKKLSQMDSNLILKRDQWIFKSDYQIKDWQFITCYLFSPLNILTSISKSTIIFTNLSILLGLTAALEDQLVLSMFSLSIGTHLSVYPSLLIPSAISIICEKRPKSQLVSFLFFHLYT
ncbi:hypothetical protein CROQUDRAFT_61628 [Cronartium quercuum f. sp. fusiforme G11]|uniref:Uncharacterized protein n=1 Tax=Cronartium quercuum f. sp. fusiforme G11 TaxID=708437 RepID=A0A9P6NIA6_9BASI|nr:hypothetical protein CROQUDRAFT_61628 [Cronartium quercuum f. sp. fusiforme G11]